MKQIETFMYPVTTDATGLWNTDLEYHTNMCLISGIILSV